MHWLKVNSTQTRYDLVHTKMSDRRVESDCLQIAADKSVDIIHLTEFSNEMRRFLPRRIPFLKQSTNLSSWNIWPAKRSV